MGSSGGSSGGGGGVTSFNTRAGAVVLSKADVTATGLAAGDVAAIAAAAAGAANGVATLDGTGNVPAGQLGNAPAAPLTFASGQLGADVAIGVSATDVIATSALAIGKWLITFTVTLVNIDAVNKGDVALRAVAGTATFVLDGPDGVETSQGPNTSTGTQVGSASFTFIADVSVAGTIKLQGTKFGSASTINAKAADSPIAHATGYTAVKIA